MNGDKRKLPAWMRATKRALEGVTTAEEAYDRMQKIFANYGADPEVVLGYVAHLMLPRLPGQKEGTANG